MSGRLVVLGTGPGSAGQLTPEAAAEIAVARHFFGYKPYLDRLSLTSRQMRHSSDNREEMDRARAALALAAEGETVAVVSGGDPGVFAMAAAVCEAIEHGPPEWRALDVAIIPGITAMLAVAARVGAPLGHDFCAISLSDNLKPWEVIETRLKAAAGAGFALALYNPVSKARPTQLKHAFDILRGVLPAVTPVVFGRAVGRETERVVITTLASADATAADMATCIIVGSPETRLVERGPDLPPLVYSPRSMPGAR